VTNPHPYRGPRPPRGPTSAKYSVIARCMRAAKQSNIDVERFEVDPVTGVIGIVVRGSQESIKESELDEWVAKRARPA
jgi:hypothetical protein